MSETAAISGDPMFIKPGIAGTDIDLRTMDALRGYELGPDSPCKGAGLKIKGNGKKDIFKTKVKSKSMDVGAAVVKR